LLDVSEPLSDEISDSDEEEEEVLRFPRYSSQKSKLNSGVIVHVLGH